MPRNILCLIICTLLCITLAGCSSDNDSSDENSSPSISTTLGENPEISLNVGETGKIAFKINTDEPVFQSDFSISATNGHVADVKYSGISGNYVYYNVAAKAAGVVSIYLEMPALGIRSDAVSVKVSYAAPDNIHASLGEEPVISVPEESNRTLCFYIGESVSPEKVTVVVNDESLATAGFIKRSGAYFYYRIDALAKGSVQIYAEVTELGLRSETVTLNIVEKGSLPTYEGMTEGYVCNTNSKTFHKPNCAYAQKIIDSNRLIYDSNDSRQEIIDAGFTPCKSCNP